MDYIIHRTSILDTQKMLKLGKQMNLDLIPNNILKLFSEKNSKTTENRRVTRHSNTPFYCRMAKIIPKFEKNWYYPVLQEKCKEIILLKFIIIIILVNTQGSHNSWKTWENDKFFQSWKILEFYNFIKNPGKWE